MHDERSCCFHQEFWGFPHWSNGDSIGIANYSEMTIHQLI